jgi:hypothetical protein
MKINKKQMLEWINALYSGEYTQAKNFLQDCDGAGYCCLGVGCILFIPKEKLNIDEDGILIGSVPTKRNQPFVPEWLSGIANDFQRETGTCLTSLNDSGNYSFEEIGMLLQLVYVHKMLD